MFNLNPFSLLQMLPIYAIILFISFPIHEFSHAWVAHRLGDDTAKYAGRLTLNPLRHLDPFGSILMLFTGLGWAKPVPVNELNFRNRREGMALTALAGPVSNLLIAFVAIVVYQVLALYSIPDWLTFFLYYAATVNITLALFNLIPINPLDGSRVLALFLPESVEMTLRRYEQVITLVLFALLLFTPVFGQVIGRLSANLYTNLSMFVAFVIHLFTPR